MAPDRPHRGHFARLHRRARGARATRCLNEAFNVGQTAHNYRIRDIAEIVAEVVPGCRLEFAPDAGPDTRSYRVSFEKIAPRAARLQAAVGRAQAAPSSSTPPTASPA